MGRTVPYLLTLILFFVALWFMQTAIAPLAKFFPRCEIVRPYQFACLER